MMQMQMQLKSFFSNVDSSEMDNASEANCRQCKNELCAIIEVDIIIKKYDKE